MSATRSRPVFLALHERRVHARGRLGPATGGFVEVPHPSHDMFCASLVTLEDGTVFVSGGRNEA